MDSLVMDLLAPLDVRPSSGDLHDQLSEWPRQKRTNSIIGQVPNDNLNPNPSNSVQQQTDSNQKSEAEQTNHTNNTTTGQTTTTTTESLQDNQTESAGGDAELLNDDEAFVESWFTEANCLELNNDDPTRRLYVNKLYQPMNAAQPSQVEDGTTSLVEQEDEYLLLYEELKRLEKDERQQVQLPKILDEDEEDDHHHEDPLDRLQLTTIIESFDSFPASPLIGGGGGDDGDGCHPHHHGRDPLISEACHHQDKPDSTKDAEVSPPDDERNNHLDNQHEARHHHHQQYDCDHEDLQQFNLNCPQDRLHQADQDSQFLSSISSDSLLNPESHNYHQQQQQVVEQQQQQQQQDTSSEISCFQQAVSTTYLQQQNSSSETTSPLSSLSPYNNNNNNNNNSSLTMEQQTSSSSTSNKKELAPEGGRQARKRCSAAADDNGGRMAKEELGTTRVKSAKKRRNTPTPSTNNNSSPSHNVSSTIMSDSTATGQQRPTKQQVAANNYHTTTTTNDDCHHHIMSEEADQSMGEEDCQSTVGSMDGQPQMSKYRRRTANARERIRMREINQAFERLKKVVPVELIHTVAGDESDGSTSRRGGSGNKSGPQSDVKLTKITTLRLAVTYIAKLSELLSQHPEGCPMTIPSGQMDGAEVNLQDGGGKSKDCTNSLPTKNVRKRQRRMSSNKTNTKLGAQRAKSVAPVASQKVAEIKVKAHHQQTNSTTQANDRLLPEKQKQVEKTTYVLSNPNQHNQRQIIITGNIAHTTQQHIFSQQQQQQQQQQSPQPQQFAYATNCHQPSLAAISQTQSGRTMMTPVALLLGIQTGSTGEGQPLQILGIQQAAATTAGNAVQAQQLHHQHQRPPQQLQPTTYNLITQQQQQVTLTLGHDMNGMSLLRLAQPTATTQVDGSAQTAIQLHQRPIIHQHQQQNQPQIFAATTTSGYNYATYQPISIPQLHQTSAQTTTTVAGGQQQFQFRPQQQQQQPQQSGGNNSGAVGNHHLSTAATSPTAIGQQQQQSAVAMKTPVTNTGNNKSDCNNSFSISPAMIAQHLNSSNSSSGSLVQAPQINFHHQQSDCSNQQQQQQILPRNLVSITPSNHQFFQSSQHHHLNGPNQVVQGQHANIIYVNPASLSAAATATTTTTTINNTTTNFQQPALQSATGNVATNNICARQTSTSSSPTSGSFEQMKFVTQQFNSGQQQQQNDVSYQNNEANIRQLVATLTTSIHPQPAASDESAGRKGEEQNELKQQQSQPQQPQQQQQQQQQPHQQQMKRTYRFHNYDGNMITNHLYSSNHDKQQQSGASTTTNAANNNNSSKRGQQQQQQQQQSVQTGNGGGGGGGGGGNSHLGSHRQRSRQNSLSSICSTTSSSSSSLISLSNASPLVVSPLVKSPSHENSTSSSASSSSTSSLSAGCPIEEEVAEEAATAAEATGNRS